MSLFKKKKETAEEKYLTKKPNEFFRQAVEKKKIKVAGWLVEKTAGYSSLQKKIALFIFCIMFGGFSLFILSGSIRGHGFNNRNLVLDHLHSGVHPPVFKTIPDSVYQKAERTKQWLDSIRQIDTNRFRIILLSRPFLLDNIQLIERIYQSQTR